MDVTLVLFKKNGSQKTFPLSSNVTVIGRRQDCDLCIPLKSVSRKHCQLSSNSDALKIRDLDSHNGTYLNSKRVEEAAVKAGDYIRIGPLTFLIQVDGKPEKIVPPPQSSAKPAGGEHGRTAPEKGLDSTALPTGDLEDELFADEGSAAELELGDSGADLAGLEDLENL